LSNLNKIYHKGSFRGGEWSKHLRPYLKRVGNKRWRKTGKNITECEEIKTFRNRKTGKRKIVVRISTHFNGLTFIGVSRYRTIRDAQNAINRPNVIHAEILKK